MMMLKADALLTRLTLSFLSLPVHQRQQRHLQAAQSIIQGTAEHSGVLPSTLKPPTETQGDESSGAGTEGSRAAPHSN